MATNMDLMKTLLEVGCLKFGEFTLKSGVKSPIYVDLRSVISYPSLLKDIAEKVWEVKLSSNISIDLVCGVPYTALPISTAISVLHDVPMVLKRKSAKDYGTKKILEGNFEAGQKCLIVEDVVTTGSSVLETVEVLRNEGLEVTNCIVVLDRQEGGEKNLSDSGITMQSLFKMCDVIPLLTSLNIVSDAFLGTIKEYLSRPKPLKMVQENSVDDKQNDEVPDNPVMQKLLKLIEEKKTNLCVAADVCTTSELLNMAEVLGPHICILKTHVDILSDFDETLPIKLRNLSQKHNFLILEDRKFADIGNVAIQQYKSGAFKIQDWADIVTVHSLPGEGLISALKMSSFGSSACVLIAQMSSEGALTTESYANETVALAEKHRDFVIGFISQKCLAKSNFLHISPGVSLSCKGDNLGQQYRTVEDAILRDGVDVIVVGRGITSSPDIVETAKVYKNMAFEAYNKKKFNS